MTSGFRGIPDELIEAAKLDGAGYFDIIRYVIIPMGKPAIILCNFLFYRHLERSFYPDDLITKHG